MLSPIRNLIIQEISATWDSLPWDARPWGVWIQQYEPIPPDAHDLPANPSLRAVWFLDSRSLREENPWSFLRLKVVYGEQPWCTKMHGEPDTMYGMGYHQIAQAAFAEYRNSHDVYLGLIWGGLNGKGERLLVDEHGCITDRKNLWIS